MSKKVLILLVGAALAFSGCGKSGGSTTSTPADSVVSTAASSGNENSPSADAQGGSAAGESAAGADASTAADPVVTPGSDVSAEDFKGHMSEDDFYLTGYTGDADAVVVPDQIDGHTVTVIDFGAFLGKGMTSVTLPDSVREIGESAFQECKNLKEIKFGSGLETIRSTAFAMCESLEKVELPEGVKTLDVVAFAYDPALKEVHVPASVEECDQFLDYDTCPDVKIYAPAGSAAAAAADAMGIPVVNE